MADVIVGRNQRVDTAFASASNGDRLIIQSGAIMPRTALTGRSITFACSAAGEIAPITFDGLNAIVDWPSVHNVQFRSSG